MKKTLLFSTVALAGAVMASEVVSSNSVGVVAVSTSAKETMIAVPFIGASGDAAIADLVGTANLTDGDMIYALPTGSDNAYKVWKLESGTWQPVTGVTVGTSPTSFTPTAATQTTLARGQAFWLVKATAPTSAISIYVMGTGATTDAAATTISKGWNLVGQSKAEGGKTLADLTAAVGKKGKVRPSGSSSLYYIYTGTKWYKVQNNATDDLGDGSSTALPAGKGFWVVREADGSGTASL